jgi:hypothetical protein
MNFKRNEATRSEYTDHFNAFIVGAILYIVFKEGGGKVSTRSLAVS